MKNSKQTFKWKGKKQKKLIAGIIEAETIQQAREQLLADHISPYQLKPYRYHTVFCFNRQKKLQPRHITIILQQLANLLSAGIDIINAISLINNQQKQILVKKTLSSWVLSIKSGVSLSEAMKNDIDNLSYQFIAAAEVSGQLEKGLLQAVDQRNHLHQLKQTLISASIYPLTVLLVAAVVIILLLSVMVPKFSQLFSENSVAIPLLTKFVMQLSTMLREKFLYLITSILIIGIITHILKKYYRRFSYYQAILLLKLPFFGGIIKKTILVRTLSTLMNGISAAIPLPELLISCADVANHPVFDWAFRQLEKHIQSGESLASSMASLTVFPSFVIAAIANGEESGKLELLLNQVIKFYQQDIDHRIQRFYHLLEPMIMLGLALVVAIILLAMYLPIFKLGSAII